jgi:hypothetical protein
MAEVKALLLKARADCAAGLPVKTESRTVGQFLEAWLRDAVAPSVRALTLEQYAQHVRLYLIPAFGRTPLQKLYPSDIQRFVAERLGVGLSARTVRISLFVLSRALAQAVKWNTIARNPVDAVDLPRAASLPIKTFSEVQSAHAADCRAGRFCRTCVSPRYALRTSPRRTISTQMGRPRRRGRYTRHMPGA